MSNRKRVHRDLQPFATDVGPEDGIDPRYLPRTSGNRRRHGRKGLQLCEQVAQTLSLVLAEARDDVLRDLMVIEVIPAPDAMHLLVTLAPAPSANKLDTAMVLECLEQHEGMLRSQVAADIHRRRVPELMYRVLT